jgi:hypothetical protein
MFNTVWKKSISFVKLDSNSSLYWINPKKTKQVEELIKNMHMIKDNYFINDLSKEIISNFEDLEKILEKLYNYYIKHDKVIYENLLKEYPSLSVELINKKIDLLKKELEKFPKKENSNNGIIDYLNKKYSSDFEKALKLYIENKHILLIKIHLYNKSKDLNFKLNEQDKISIKKVSRFILKEEIPLIDKIIKLSNFLDKFETITFNKEVKEKIFKLKAISKLYTNYNISNSLKEQYIALNKNNLYEFSNAFQKEIDADEYLSSFSELHGFNKYKKIKSNLIKSINLTALGKAAALALILLSNSLKTFANNLDEFKNNNHTFIENNIVDVEDGLNKNNFIDQLIKKHSITYKKDTIFYNVGSKKTVHYIMEKKHLRPEILSNFLIANKLGHPVALEDDVATDKPLKISNYDENEVINNINNLDFSQPEIRFSFDMNNIKIYGTQRFNDSIRDVTISIAKCQGSYFILNDASLLKKNMNLYLRSSEIEKIDEIIDNNKKIILENMHLFLNKEEQEKIKPSFNYPTNISPFLSYYNKHVLEKRDLDLEKSLLLLPEKEFTLIYGAGHLEAIKKIAKENNINLIIYEVSNNIQTNSFSQIQNDDAIGGHMGSFYNDRMMDSKFLNMFRRHATQRFNDPHFNKNE